MSSLRTRKAALKRQTAPRALRGGVRADATDQTRLFEELRTTFAAFQEAHTTQMAELKKGLDDAVTRDKVAAINASVSDLQTALDDINQKIAAIRVGPGGGENVSAEVLEYRRLYAHWFRTGKGEDALNEAAVKAELSVGEDPAGGYTVSDTMETTIDRVLEDMSPMRAPGMARIVSISTNSYKRLVTVKGASAGWVGEKDPRQETDTPELSELEFPVKEMYAQPYATQTLLDDSSVNIAQWLSDEVVMEFAEQEGEAFITGDGVKKPRGILAYPFVANANWSWGNIGQINSGAANGFAATDPADAFIDLVYALRRGYRQGARWLMNDLTTAEVRKFKDGQGNYLWQPSAQAGEPASFLGYPHETDDFMPDVAANSYPVAFANFNRGYLIVDRVGVRVLRDPYTRKPYVAFYTTKRVGGGVQNFQAIKVMQIAA